MAGTFSDNKRGVHVMQYAQLIAFVLFFFVATAFQNCYFCGIVKRLKPKKFCKSIENIQQFHFKSLLPSISLLPYLAQIIDLSLRSSYCFTGMVCILC